jgi:hypothetical protein
LTIESMAVAMTIIAMIDKDPFRRQAHNGRLWSGRGIRFLTGTDTARNGIDTVKHLRSRYLRSRWNDCVLSMKKNLQTVQDLPP